MGKIRQIEKTRYGVEVMETQLPADLGDWLARQAVQLGLTTLLAHADDGLIWGRVQGSEVRIAHDFFPDISPPLRAETLWQLWLFSPQGELYLWQDGGTWRRRAITEGDGESEYYDEHQMLWGVCGQQAHDGFTLVYEGQQGLAHAVPLEVPQTAFDGERHPLRLRIRHYLTPEPESGLLRVTLSRLVELYEEVRQ
jgi:CRISPR-associated protein (TIGR03984 family)